MPVAGTICATTGLDVDREGDLAAKTGRLSLPVKATLSPEKHPMISSQYPCQTARCISEIYVYTVGSSSVLSFRAEDRREFGNMTRTKYRS